MSMLEIKKVFFFSQKKCIQFYNTSALSREKIQPIGNKNDYYTLYIYIYYV